MDKVLIFNVDGIALQKCENRIEELLEHWLRIENNKNVYVTSFAFEDMGSINVDCIHLIDDEEINITRELSEKILNELNIHFELDNQ